MPAQRRVDGAWYMGTANAVLQNIDIIHAHAQAHYHCSLEIISTRWTTR
ncbi:MAG: hypothetical protein IPH22_13005 [Nitrosomonas sp.]|nr:hypothetical protein [Nitrosomonas sp.]